MNNPEDLHILSDDEIDDELRNSDAFQNRLQQCKQETQAYQTI